MKVYARTRKIHDAHCFPVPYNINIATAIQGFHEMGFEIYEYEKLSEAYDLYEKGDIVMDDKIYALSPPSEEKLEKVFLFI